MTHAQDRDETDNIQERRATATSPLAFLDELDLHFTSLPLHRALMLQDEDHGIASSALTSFSPPPSPCFLNSATCPFSYNKTSSCLS
eukprot:m.48043 g.48043  ORF g.48043 m.48043 type:complete len:87 (-) comp12371_c1_seq1:198-458(-)